MDWVCSNSVRSKYNSLIFVLMLRRVFVVYGVYVSDQCDCTGSLFKNIIAIVLAFAEEVGSWVTFDYIVKTTFIFSALSVFRARCEMWNSMHL